MNSINLVVNYKPCSICNKALVKDNVSVCKECKPKPIPSRALDKNLKKRYLNKFEAKNLSYTKGMVEETKNKNIVVRYSKFRLKSEIALPNNAETSARFFTLYWDQFKNFNSFSSFITKSGQVSTTYFGLNSCEIQKKPFFQHFIQTKQDKLPNIQPSTQLIIPIPYSRPLQLLAQKSYWDSLIANYFRYLHFTNSSFSIYSFNPNTAAKPLISAICFGGFQFMQDKPSELISYFNEYAKLNIREATRAISLQNTQAILLYSYLMLLVGNFSLSRDLLIYSIRMGYALGLHLNIKRLSPIQRYDRLKLFSTMYVYQITFSELNHLALNHLIEIGEYDGEILKPKYQIPNQYCAFCFDTEGENIVYGVCMDIYSKVLYILTRSIWTLSNCSDNSIKVEFDRCYTCVVQKYTQATQTFNIQMREFPKLKSVILSHKFQLDLMYRTFTLEMYGMLKSKISTLDSNYISNMIYECSSLFDSVVESQNFSQISHLHPYFAGFYYINIYSISNNIQKMLIKKKLQEIMDFLSSRFCADKLSYLIIKNEYESILRSQNES